MAPSVGLPAVTPEVIELLVGTVVVASIITTYYLCAPHRARRHQAVRRSLSCSGLQDLHNKQLAIDACADMFERFEERCPGGRRTRVPRVPSLPALIESDGESFTQPMRRRTKSLPASVLERVQSLPASALERVLGDIPLPLSIEAPMGNDRPAAPLADAEPDDEQVLLQHNLCLGKASAPPSHVEDGVMAEAKHLCPLKRESWGVGDTARKDGPDIAKPNVGLPMLAVDVEDHEWVDQDPSPTGGSSPDVWVS